MISILVSLLLTPVQAQTYPDIDMIKGMAGCYEVTYRFWETEGYQDGYELYPPYQAKAKELIVYKKTISTVLNLQHILITSEGMQKHWRQSWQYEPANYWGYIGNNTWKKIAVNNGAGKWVQRAMQVDDSPRYECLAAFQNQNGQWSWECPTWSPLPRREYTQRDDYNILARTNKHSLTATGWVHEQKNDKLLLANSNVTKIAHERGENTYKRLPDEECEAAMNWWQTYEPVWAAIRHAWLIVYDQNEVLSFKSQVDGLTLWMRLFELADLAVEQNLQPLQIRREALNIINRYL